MINKVKGSDKRWKRSTGWVGIIIHHTGVGGRKTISAGTWWKLYKNITKYLSKKDSNFVSAHYTISRGGSITCIIDPAKYEAFHAGRSEYYHPIKRKWLPDWNRYAVGIELIGDGNLHEYSSDQYKALAYLCKDLIKDYKIDPRCITGHENVAPKRKSDPGKYFDWDKLFRMLY